MLHAPDVQGPHVFALSYLCSFNCNIINTLYDRYARIVGAKGPAPAIPARTYQAPMSPPSQTYSPSSSPPSTNSASVNTGSSLTVSSSTASTGYRAQPPAIPSTYQSQPVAQAATAVPSGGLYTPTPPQSAPPPTMGTAGTGSAITRSVSPPPVPSYGNAGTIPYTSCDNGKVALLRVQASHLTSPPLLC